MTTSTWSFEGIIMTIITRNNGNITHNIHSHIVIVIVRQNTKESFVASNSFTASSSHKIPAHAVLVKGWVPRHPHFVWHPLFCALPR